MELRQRRIYSVFDILRECVKESRRVSSPWDSGSETAVVMGTSMGTLVGTQSPAYTLRRFHLHNYKRIGNAVADVQQATKTMI